MNVVIINTSGCEHTVHSEEQLKLFLESGWKVKEEEQPKDTTRKKSKAKE